MTSPEATSRSGRAPSHLVAADKIVGRRLAPFLASFTGEAPAPDVPPPGLGLEVDLAVDATDVHRLATSLPDTAGASSARRPGAKLVGGLMTPDPLVGRAGDDARRRRRDDAPARRRLGARRGGGAADRDHHRARCAARRRVRRKPSEASARQWMTAGPVTVREDTTLDVAEALMTEYGIHHLPVVDGERPVGMVGLRAVTRSQREAKRLAIGLGF